MGTTSLMFHIFELGEGDKYDVPPSKASLALYMAAAKRCLSESTNMKIPDMICACGSEVTEEDVEATVLEKNRAENIVAEVHFAGIRGKD